MKVAEYKALAAKKVKPSKYRNRRVERDGLRFDSVAEADRFAKLLLLEKAGEIRNLRRQVRYDFVINGKKCGWYVADHVYDEQVNGFWAPVVEDVKGFRTDVFKLKKRLMAAIHNIEIREIKK